MKSDYSNYQSPFSWRYGSDAMRTVWSEEHKFLLWRKIWVELVRAESEIGIVSKKELQDLETNEKKIDIDRIFEIEGETHHDVVAAIREYAEKAKIGGGKIHVGATSMDIVDNADAMRVLESLELIEKKVITLLSLFADKINKYADVACIGYTHLQPAEPTTVGYRFAFYAQDLLLDYEMLQFVKGVYTTKGLKGAVGTAASYKALIGDSNVKEGFWSADYQTRNSQNDNQKGLTVEEFEKKVMEKLGLNASLISTQVNSRKFDYLVLSLLNSICQTFAKFAGDLRILQSPSIGEWSEPFSQKQVGSSAMPFKRNPRMAENICSLARYVSSLPQVALENATLSYLERTLDDSGNRRIILPECFLATDEILKTAEKIISGMTINERRVAFNLSQFAPFAASEGILMMTVKNGADRQKMHEELRRIAMTAWEKVQKGEENHMESLLLTNTTIQKYLNKKTIESLLNVKNHVGDAPERARKLLGKIRKSIKIK